MTAVQARRATPDPLTSPSTRPPIVYWAAVGLLGLLTEIYVLSMWFISGDATPSPKGPDPVPSATMTWIWVLQIVSPIVMAATIVYIVRRSRQEGRLCFDGMLLLAWLTVAWQDPILSYVRPVAFSNAAAINLGSWAEHIPGWITPNYAKMPYPLIFWICLYFFSVLFSILCCRTMQWAKARWPRLGKGALILIAFASMALADLVVEVIMVRSEVIGYPGVVRSLSLWGGTSHQFPLYEAVLWGGVWASGGILRYFRDDRGRTVIERGDERLSVSDRRRTGIRILALAGFMSLWYVAAYDIPMVWMSLHVDQTPEYPSYLRAGVCGPDTPYDCAGPTVPIQLPGTTPPRPGR